MLKRTGFEAGRLALVLWLVSVITFLTLRMTPGDPALLLLGPQASRPDAAPLIAALHEKMGLDKSWLTQYGIWIRDVLTGNFGHSNYNDVEVTSLISKAVPSTIWLILLSVLVSVPISIFVGMRAAGHSNGVMDRFVRGTKMIFISLPGVWSGLLLIILFSVELKLLPSGGYIDPFEDPMNFLRHEVLPVATLSFYLIGVLTRFVYTEGLDVLRRDYMRTSKAMGLPERTRLYLYAQKNAILPLITMVGVQIGALVGGAVLVEAVFGLGGLGQLLLNSVFNRDYQVVQAAVLLTTAITLLLSFLSDIAYRLVDPRIKR